MRRELKVLSSVLRHGALDGHKAYPDEKGTESGRHPRRTCPRPWVTRHIPMRRELKGNRLGHNLSRYEPGHKAYPDEKGTESGAAESHEYVNHGQSQGISR